MPTKKAVVLTGYDKFFSAGLNLKSLPEDRDGMASFVDSFEEAHLALLQFPLPVVAAVNGHAIAGGCVLACAADLRIGAEGSHKLGVSEVSLGIVFPGDCVRDHAPRIDKSIDSRGSARGEASVAP